MQLEYKVLWIDDNIQEQYIDRNEVKKIEEFIEGLGFAPHIITATSADEASSEIEAGGFDLIISDYNLGTKNGDELVADIRNEKKSTAEILFYSANSEFTEDAGVTKRIAFLDRISFQRGREGLIEKIEWLIRLTVTKLLELNATRGVIVSATSDLDAMIEKLILVICKDHLGLKQTDYDAHVTNYQKTHLEKRPQHFADNYKEFDFDWAVKEMEAMRTWRLFRKLLKKLNEKQPSPSITKFLEENQNYDNEVILKRNKLAHANAAEVDGKMVLLNKHGGDHFEADETQCIQMRKDIIKHQRHFDELKSHLENKIKSKNIETM